MVCAGIFTVAAFSAAQSPGVDSEPEGALVAGAFTSATRDGTPVGWRRKDFKGRSSFSILEEEQMGVLRAESAAAASGLFREFAADPQEFPVVRWRWKVSRVVESADEREKRADDAAARVFVIFKDSLPGAGAFSKFKHKLAAASGAVAPGVSLCYIWSNRLPRGEVIRSPYTDWVGIIAVEQGEENAGSWVSVERNVRADFRRVFGAEPKQITGVAVMSDTDNTGESVTAFYSAIVFGKEQSGPGAKVIGRPLDSLPASARLPLRPGEWR
jgi:hypothetical protein